FEGVFLHYELCGSIQYLPDPNIDGGWGWIVVGVTFLIRVIVDGFIFTRLASSRRISPIFSNNHGCSIRCYVYPIWSCQYFSKLLAISKLTLLGPIASGLINNYGCRVVSFIGTGISCAGLLLSLAVPRVEYLSVTLGLISEFHCQVPVVCWLKINRNLLAPGASWFSSRIEERYLHGGFGHRLSYFRTIVGLAHQILSWLERSFSYSNWNSTAHRSIFFFYKTFTIHSFKRDISTLEDPSTSNDEASSSQKSDKSRRISKGTQTDKKGEKIKGLYTIRRSSIQAQSCTSAHLTGLMEKSDILYEGNSGCIFHVSRQLQTAPIVSQDVPITDVRSTWSRFIDTVGKMMGLSLLKNYVFLVFFLLHLSELLWTSCSKLLHISPSFGT
ncbi:monocarboxylate transporter 14, partial [Caerostris extrusa]